MLKTRVTTGGFVSGNTVSTALELITLNSVLLTVLVKATQNTAPLSAIADEAIR